jgi:hypothetical protein
MLDMLKLAAKYAPSNEKDGRVYFLGAVGIRDDGRIVHARNSAVLDTETKKKWSEQNVYKRFPGSHAEVRLTKKLGFGATIYVARVARGSGELAMARPCECCQSVIKAFRVKKVYYTISHNQWGIWDPVRDTDTYYIK